MKNNYASNNNNNINNNNNYDISNDKLDMSNNNNSLRKDKSEIYMISENDDIFNNTKRKKQKKMLHREKISKKIMAKSSDTNKDLSNRIFLTGDSIVKHVRNYELSRKKETAKFMLRAFRVQRSCVWIITYNQH